MKPADVKSSTYTDFDIENNDKDPNFKVGDHVRIFGQKRLLLLKKLKILCHEHMDICNTRP